MSRSGLSADLPRRRSALAIHGGPQERIAVIYSACSIAAGILATDISDRATWLKKLIRVLLFGQRLRQQATTALWRSCWARFFACRIGRYLVMFDACAAPISARSAAASSYFLAFGQPWPSLTAAFCTTALRRRLPGGRSIRDAPMVFRSRRDLARTVLDEADRTAPSARFSAAAVLPFPKRHARTPSCG